MMAVITALYLAAAPPGAGASVREAAPLPTRPTAAWSRFQYSEVHMGGAVRITLHAPDRDAAERAARAAFARIAALEDVASDYRPTSEVSRLAARAGVGPVPVSDDLFRLLARSRDVARASGGAFDPTCGPIVALWRQARRDGALPDPAALRAARERVGWRALRLDAEARTAEVRTSGLRVDLGGVAKGDAGDQALAVLRAAGVRSALIELGGDLVAGDPPPGEIGWRVRIRGVPGPAGEVRLANAAMSTSGDAEQHVEIGGVRYSHIVDPRTGIGVTHRRQVTVIGRDGLTTDPLATALSVLGPGRAADRLAATAGVEVRWLAPKSPPMWPDRAIGDPGWCMLEP